MQTLEFFQVSSKDNLQMLVASESPENALEVAHKALDRWELTILPATEVQIQQFSKTLAQSVSIH